MSRYVVDSKDLSDVADAIRIKGGTSASLEFPDGFVSAVEDIGGDDLYSHNILLIANTGFDSKNNVYPAHGKINGDTNSIVGIVGDGTTTTTNIYILYKSGTLAALSWTYVNDLVIKI